jgi:hypothetical protein
MLQETTKHHLRSNGVEWMHLWETTSATSVHQNSAFRPETQVLHLFTHERFSKCSKGQQNIIWGPMEWNGCIWCDTIVANSVHRTQVLHHFTGQRSSKSSKTLPNISLDLME